MSDCSEGEELRRRHERKMQLQRERRQRQREEREAMEPYSDMPIESGIEKQLRLIAESSIKREQESEDEELDDEEDMNESNGLDTITDNATSNSYGREIRELFQQIEDPEERAKLRRARRAQMQRLRRKRIREQQAEEDAINGKSMPSASGRQSMDTESMSRSIASSPATPMPNMLTRSEEAKLEKQRADTRERQRRRRARLNDEKRTKELEADRERQRRRRARLSLEKREHELEAGRERQRRRRAKLNEEKKERELLTQTSNSGFLTIRDRGENEEFDEDDDTLDYNDEDNESRTGDGMQSIRRDSELSDDGFLDEDNSNSVPIVSNGKSTNNTLNMDENSFTLLLIKRISEEPSLYDINNENYTNDNLRHRAFMRIQERLEREGATLPQATSVRDKFRILKRRFISEHEKYANESKWSLYKPLRFMIPYVEATNLRKRSKPGTFKRRHESPAPTQVDRLDVKAFLENLSQVQLKFQNEFTKASSSNQFDDYDSKMDSAEKIQFNSMFRPWLLAHSASPICSRQQYTTILTALKRKARGTEFSAEQMEEYNMSCRYLLQSGGSSPVILSKATDKQIVCEDEVYEILAQVHLSLNHGRRDSMIKKLINYEGLAVRELVLMFLKCCQTCELNNGERSALQRTGSFYDSNNGSIDGDNINYSLSMLLNDQNSNGNGNLNV